MSENAIAPGSISKKDFLRSGELRNHLQVVKRRIVWSQEKVASVKSERKKMVSGEWSLESRDHGNAALLGSLSVLQNEEDVLATLCEQRDHISAEIASLIPTREQVEERARHQHNVEKLALDRVEIDKKVDEALGALRNVLNERAAVTEKITGLASAIDLEVGPDKFDAQRFDDFVDSLPVEFSEATQRWTDRFLGAEAATSAYVVCVDRLILPETLAHVGVYYFGDSIELTTEDAAPLLGGGLIGSPLDSGIPRDSSLRQPPSIATVEEFGAATAKAHESGMPIGEYLFHLLKARGLNVAPHTRFNVTITAESDVKHGGKTYRKGEKFDASVADAVNVIETGAAKPLAV